MPAHGGRAWPRPAAGPSASGTPELILTFDDGPHELYTPLILDELGKRGLRATFFWVGHRVVKPRRYRQQRRDLVRRAIREGHLVGNHTINHAQLCAGPKDRAAEEIDVNEAIYGELTGMPVRVFRAPYGAKCDRLRGMLAERNLNHFHWDFDPQEWMHHDARETVQYVIRKLRGLTGRAVLLMHDTKQATVRALPAMLDWIERENERRSMLGEPPIRIVSYVDLAREQLAPGLEDWLRDAVSGTLSLAESTAALIPGPGAGRAHPVRASL
jgi:peptidoglycan-N-acetylglucosamine deacetylase